jgi:hypothetical protein
MLIQFLLKQKFLPVITVNAEQQLKVPETDAGIASPIQVTGIVFSINNNFLFNV